MSGPWSIPSRAIRSRSSWIRRTTSGCRSKAPGVAEKLVGVFTERRSEAGLIKLDAGASYVARGKGVYVVTRGAGAVGSERLRPLTTLYLGPGETAAVTAREETEIGRAHV